MSFGVLAFLFFRSGFCSRLVYVGVRLCAFWPCRSPLFAIPCCYLLPRLLSQCYTLQPGVVALWCWVCFYPPLALICIYGVVTAYVSQLPCANSLPWAITLPWAIPLPCANSLPWAITLAWAISLPWRYHGDYLLWAFHILYWDTAEIYYGCLSCLSQLQLLVHDS